MKRTDKWGFSALEQRRGGVCSSFKSMGREGALPEVKEKGRRKRAGEREGGASRDHQEIPEQS